MGRGPSQSETLCRRFESYWGRRIFPSQGANGQLFLRPHQSCRDAKDSGGAHHGGARPGGVRLSAVALTSCRCVLLGCACTPGWIRSRSGGCISLRWRRRSHVRVRPRGCAPEGERWQSACWTRLGRGWDLSGFAYLLDAVDGSGASSWPASRPALVSMLAPRPIRCCRKEAVRTARRNWRVGDGVVVACM